MRADNEGWGAISILVELKEFYGYDTLDLPSADAVHRFLKSKKLIAKKIPTSPLPETIELKPKDFHDLWEMDAQGAEKTGGVDFISMINIKDNRSKVYVSSFPVQVKSSKTKPKRNHYLWAMRFGFEEFGLPKVIQVDKDTAFRDSKPTSAFPSQIHLFLIGLGIDLIFINVSPPQKQAIVERSHQTMSAQVLKGKSYSNWHELYINTVKRKRVMNELYPSRTLKKQAPLKAQPKAKHSGRPYSVEREKDLLKIERIEAYLAKCTWYRKTAKSRTLSLHGKVYYLNQAEANVYLKINFCPEGEKLIFRNDKELVVQEVLVKSFVKKLLNQPSVDDLLKTKSKILSNKNFIL